VSIIFFKENPMPHSLTNEITAQTEIFFHNINTSLLTCDMQAELCGMPIWQHGYHMLHSIDQWFINPAQYSEPPFHVENLNSLNVTSDKTLSKAELLDYLEAIQAKIMRYFAHLTDEELCEKPDGCIHTRLALILGSFRHTYSHLGNINAATMMATGQWPRVVGLDGDYTKGLFE
jgi:hypothetical protein